MAETTPTSADTGLDAPKISQELRHQLEGLVQEWRQTTTQPPCTIGQLVLVVLLLGAPCKRGEIFSRILRSSGYYATLASSQILRWSFDYDGPQQEDDITASARSLHFDFNKVFSEFDMPLVSLRDQDSKHDVYTVSSNEARMMLSPLLEGSTSTSTKPFPFMRLPTELREIIYDMVMSLPKSGICPPLHADETRLQVFSRDHRTETSIQDPRKLWKPLAANPLPYYLDILLVSRQIHQEALPTFYKRNNLVFRSQAIMENKLQALAVHRRNHIEHLSFVWERSSKTQAERCFKRLAKMPFLRRLDIHINEKDWIAGTPDMELSHLKQIHGFTALRRIRGLETVNFFGHCGNVRAALAKELMQPKQGKPQQKAGIKRKALKEIEGNNGAEAPRKTRSMARANGPKAAKKS